MPVTMDIRLLVTSTECKEKLSFGAFRKDVFFMAVMTYVPAALS